MATIEKNVPVPTPTKAASKPRLSEKSKDILDTLTQAEIGDSFVIEGNYRAVALIAGKLAKRLGKAIVSKPEANGARVWVVEPKPAKVAAE